MKPNPRSAISLAPHWILAGLWSAVCASWLAAPLLAAHGHGTAAGLLYALFSRVCHQDPSRCFHIAGYPLAVCMRCCGIYLGLLAVALLPADLNMLVHEPRRRRFWVVLASAPMGADVVLQWCGIWTNTPASRLATGLLFGGMLSSLLVPAAAEFLHQAPWRRRHPDVDPLGGYS